jgi:hypothetical protein
MSYDQLAGAGRTEEYGPWGAEAFGGGSLVHQIIGPKGCVGFVRDLLCEVTVAMVGTTTVPEIAVGISSGDATFGRYRLGSVVGTGYGLGMQRAGAEQLQTILTQPGRALADYAGHVQLDGGPYTSTVIAGGTSSTVLPAGRIPASGNRVVNAVSGTAGVVRLFLDQPIDPLLKVGQLVKVLGVQGATGVPTTAVAISAINAAQNFIELTGTTFGGTYTGGGIVNIVVVITEVAGAGGTPAGTGHVRVQIDWHGGDRM